MNLPLSAVTPSIPKTPNPEYSDYMNIEPKDIHIYQNTSILSINTSGQDRSMVAPLSQSDITVASPHADTSKMASISSNHNISANRTNCNESANQSSSSANSVANRSVPSHNSFHCHKQFSNSSLTPTGNDSQRSHDLTNRMSNSRDLINPLASTSIESPNTSAASSRKLSSGHTRDCSDIAGIRMPPDRRREALADSSFVERKYGLVFSETPPDGS